MGGQSSSSFTWQGDNLLFEGFVNTHGGGFASIRTLPTALLTQSLKDISRPAVTIVVKGDGQRYQLGVQTRAAMNYWVDLVSTPQWRAFSFPLTQFVAKRRGRRIAQAPALQAVDVTGFNLMISHGQHGPFTVQIRNLLINEANTIES